jgi:hypothetical protein
LPSAPTRASAGTSTSSRNTSVVAWFIIVRIGRIATRSPAAARSRRNRDIPSLLRSTSAYGVVRASSSMRSEWSAREVQIFWPRMT